MTGIRHTASMSASRAEHALGPTQRLYRPVRHGAREALCTPTGMIDPIHSLAFSVQSNPRVYAVLIGSGVSRAAGIPTGWEVTLDLIRKLATVLKEEPEPNPEAWFEGKFGTKPDYSDLLDQLAKTQAERQQLLRSYWESTEEEREEGLKTPTAAHRAIATLAVRGFIKVIVTTNFDRLMEQALAAQGIEATVLSTPDQIEGAQPLDHISHLVLKVHGDYLDPRILNTAAELAEYPRQVKELLHRIFDEYGLIVCGWSGDWDKALAGALERASSRRYTTYWTTRSEPSESAKALIRQRRAEVIRIEDADRFFDEVAEDVTAIEELSKPHPLSVEVGVKKLKRYMAEARFRIRLFDLIEDAVQEAIDATSGDAFSTRKPAPTPELAVMRLRAYDTAYSRLTAMAAAGGAWAEREHYPLWRRALERLCTAAQRDGNTVWCGLQRYPATLLLYALGLGAVDRGRLEFLRELLTVRIETRGDKDVPAIWTLSPYVLLPMGGSELHGPGGLEANRTPLNLWIHDSLKVGTQSTFREEVHFTRTFDKLEILLALGSRATPAGALWDSALPGCYYWRGETRNRFLAEIKESLEALEERSPYVRSGFLRQRRQALPQRNCAVGAEHRGEQMGHAVRA